MVEGSRLKSWTETEHVSIRQVGCYENEGVAGVRALVDRGHRVWHFSRNRWFLGFVDTWCARRHKRSRFGPSRPGVDQQLALPVSLDRF